MMRSLRVVITVALGSLLVSALATGPAGSQTVTPKVPKATSACKLLTTDEITAVFDDAPLDPGPRKIKLPDGGLENFSQCVWYDNNGDGSAPRLMARTSLALGVTSEQAKRLTKPVPNSSGRELTDLDLRGLGSKGTIEINENGTSGSVGALKGDNFYIVTVGYVGGPSTPSTPTTPITDADILTLARTAAKRV
jgi:hypothetical protein